MHENADLDALPSTDIRPGMSKTYGNVSDDAVRNATGRGWDEWVTVLDDAGAEEMSHKEIAAMLTQSGLIGDAGGWWAQSVTVGYEYAKGRRVKGETADAGFQLGVQKTLPVDADAVWRLITSLEGMRIWLGSVNEPVPIEKGVIYETRDGTTGEIRSVVPGTRLRLTWKPSDVTAATTLQLHLTPKGERTALLIHHEKLRDADHRAAMKEHWQAVLKRLSGEIR
jgi:uncharacterized protein YndB with AHSA1/START domain